MDIWGPCGYGTWGGTPSPNLLGGYTWQRLSGDRTMPSSDYSVVKLGHGYVHMLTKQGMLPSWAWYGCNTPALSMHNSSQMGDTSRLSYSRRGPGGLVGKSR